MTDTRSLDELLEDWTLLTNALAAFQSWKTRSITKEKEAYGPGWGEATGWNQADWTDRNKEFIDAIEGDDS